MEFINKVLEAHAKEVEENGGMEDGDQSVYLLNDAVVVLSLEDKNLSVNVIVGEPYSLNVSTGLLDDDNE
ncbi:hypothetical protein CHL76_02425 [Marinococcus halophilus]|uniref:Uncharacterized protein n=1 Tax=Marinococcus halophilus TaxID=1371 RepID=A0A510Y1I3_MARHA|nr:hypothetical protein [Marinococcus halophilus]OZT81231.1 hypothetical protein CHL76_02425 [Marinococcus halophilus]GEK57170.1 hypothetical protein MHA01_00750 [Marinococcus halophilus]